MMDGILMNLCRNEDWSESSESGFAYCGFESLCVLVPVKSHSSRFSISVRYYKIMKRVKAVRARAVNVRCSCEQNGKDSICGM